LALLGAHGVARAQIDPEERRLIQFGYNQPIQGHAPLAAYGFYYWNQPDFYSTNLTLRLAFAGVYVDSELGFKSLLGPNTDLGVGVGGGGFADMYGEIRHGVFERKESFQGDAAEVSASIYHLFDPGRLIPLFLVFHGIAHESLYRRDSDTAPNFELPPDQTSFHLRTGLRFGGEEPTLTSPMGMELSVWHEAQFRTEPDHYGYNGDREVRPQSQLIWGRALFKYLFDPSEQLVEAGISSGTSWDADRFSAYRLGGSLPFSSEFPLSIPGYYFHEFSAVRYALFGAQYSLPIAPSLKNWRVNVQAATAWVDYLPGLEQPGNWNTGLGGGMTYISPSGSWFLSVLYGHGFDAMRSHGRGGDEVAFLFQYDFEAKARGKSRFFTPSPSQGAGQRYR
jgi:hypothetical protein